jgi:hypothetical protein
LVILMKDRPTPMDSRNKAVDALIHRWKKGMDPQPALEGAVGWAAQYGSRGSRFRALAALEGRGSSIGPALAGLKNKDEGTQTRSIAALAAIASRTGTQAQARTALEAYLAGGPSNKNAGRARAALSGL